MTDSDKQKLEQARKAGLNGWICRALRFSGEQTAKALAQTPITPNQVTILAFLLIFLGCLFALMGNKTGWVLFSIFLIAGTVLDFADGSLARLKNQSSRLGFYLDNTLDDLGGILIAFSVLGGLWNSGEKGPILAAPILIYACDVMITHIMTRYRSEFLDPIASKQDTEKIFKESFLLNLGRNLVPPFYPRLVLFFLASLADAVIAYIIFDVFYNLTLSIALGWKVGIDIRASEK